MAKFQLPVLLSLLGLFSTAFAVKPLAVSGTQFVDPESDSTRFQIIGVDYQPGGTAAYEGGGDSDVLTDADACLRDAVLFQRLGVNTVRIYNLNPTLNHDECVSIFNAAGIYLLLDVNSPIAGESLHREEPWTTYHKGYLKRIFQMVEAFMDYPNVLGFFGGNEVINEDAHKDVPAYLRAVQRDLKNYISKHAPREIPVGYSAADVREVLEDTWNYVSCEDPDSPASRADFFGLNSYSWCGTDATYKSSGFNKLVDMFSDSPNPVFFSEYGCNEVQPREFTEVAAIYGENMVETFAGGLVYEFTQEKNDYGLVKINDNSTVSLIVDYEFLMEQYANIDIEMLQSLNSTSAQIDPPKCKSDLIKTKEFLKDFEIPELPPGGKKLIENGVDGASKGKLVEVKETKVKSTVYASDGSEITGLELQIVDDDEWNVPGENTSGESSGNGGGGGDEDIAGHTVTVSAGSIIAAVAAFFLLA